jgi:hypothetical protein
MRAVGGSPVEDGACSSRSESSGNGDEGDEDGGRGIDFIMPCVEVPTADYSRGGVALDRADDRCHESFLVTVSRSRYDQVV